MRRLQDVIADENDPFGPGTDLIISMFAMLLIIVLISSKLYHEKLLSIKKHENELERITNLLAAKMKENKELKVITDEQKKIIESGNFKLASEYFSAGHFKVNPVISLMNPTMTVSLVNIIIQEYRQYQAEFPFIFIIGHANQIDDPKAIDKSYRARLQRNWEYAGRRAVLIAGLMQEYLTEAEREKIIVTTTGEFDMKAPEKPYSQENARVEVVFGKEWKLPAASSQQEALPRQK